MFVGTEIHTFDFRFKLGKLRKTLISQRSRISAKPHAKKSEHKIKTRKIRNRKKEQNLSYSKFMYERYNKVEASAMRAVGEIPSSNNLRLQNLVESQLEITKTESSLDALSAKFALKSSLLVPLA